MDLSAPENAGLGLPFYRVVAESLRATLRTRIAGPFARPLDCH